MISIVMPYYNRKQQLLNTLKSIRYFGSPEIIVVDDGSDEDQRIEDIEGITLIRVPKELNKWINPCIPFNRGFSKANGDIILLNQSECIHTSNILSFIENLTPGNYYSFATYSLDKDIPDNFTIPELVPMIMKEPQQESRNHHGWYNHSIYIPSGYSFCSAITRKDLDKLQGFDERYGAGVGADDREFIFRIRLAGINVQIIDSPFVIHQKHERTDYIGNRRKYIRNTMLYKNVTWRGKFIKAPENKYYENRNIDNGV